MISQSQGSQGAEQTPFLLPSPKKLLAHIKLTLCFEPVFAAALLGPLRLPVHQATAYH